MPSSASAEQKEDDAVAARLRSTCSSIDTDANGWISKLQLVQSMQRDPEVAELVLPGVDSAGLLSNEASFDVLDATFAEMAGGRSRVRLSELVAYLRAARRPSQVCELRRLFDVVDADGFGFISKLQLLDAVHRDQEVAELVLPNGGPEASGQEAFDAVDRAFEAAAGGRRRISFQSFRDYFSSAVSVEPSMVRTNTVVQRERSAVRVFVMDPGGLYKMGNRPVVEQAGCQVHWCTRFPPVDPASPFPWHLLADLKAEIDAIQPRVLMCAWKAAMYSFGLWQSGEWQGPTVLINPHPVCQQLPPGMPVVIAHGGIDESFKIARHDLEKLVYGTSQSRSLLYYVSPNLHLGASLKKYDCLGRLIDAAVCPDGPEASILRSWRERKACDRIVAERNLGCTLEQIRKHWVSPGRRGRERSQLFSVPADSEEFAQVSCAFFSQPRESPAYPGRPDSKFDQVQIVSIQRVENGLQVDGCSKPYLDCMSRSLEDQGLEFEPGVHTCWAFHGSPEVDSIVTNPIAGIQPLASGTKNATLWGSGTYFARDAKYVVDGCFDLAGGQRPANGVRRILMCLLATGVPCLGDPEQRGVLPFRKHPHRFHSSVDSLSSPEIYVVQHPGAAHPGYVITFQGA
jgi:Ca2+-binding EF-hand superfamily protein